MRLIVAILFVLSIATIAFAMSPGEFHDQWAKNRYIKETDKSLDMIRYTVRSYHFYHFRVTELKARPNRMEGSKAWLIQRIVRPKPDAVIISLVPRGESHPLMSFPRELACLEYRKTGPVLVWQTDDVAATLVKVILRAEGYCPI